MGALRTALDLLRGSLKNSTEFQKLVGTEGYPEMADMHIYDHAIPVKATRGTDRYKREELEAVRPFALICNAPDNPVQDRASRGGGECNWDIGGIVTCHIERDAPPEMDLNEAAVDFEKIVDGICDDIRGQSEMSGRLDAIRITSVGPTRNQEQEYAQYGDAQWYVLSILWGQTEA